jgi:hypothetical protein
MAATIAAYPHGDGARREGRGRTGIVLTDDIEVAAAPVILGLPRDTLATKGREMTPSGRSGAMVLSEAPEPVRSGASEENSEWNDDATRSVLSALRGRPADERGARVHASRLAA